MLREHNTIRTEFRFTIFFVGFKGSSFGIIYEH